MNKSIKKTQPQAMVFEQTGEIRNVKRGEYYIDSRGSMIKYHYDYATIYEHEIWRKVTKDE